MEDSDGDVFGELRTAFDQVRMDRWYSTIERFTFRTKYLDVSRAQGEALLRHNLHVRGQRSSAPSADDVALLSELEHTLTATIVGEFDGAAFLKFCDRSPKDAATEFDNIRPFYEAVLPTIADTEPNRTLQALVTGTLRSFKVSNGAEALQLLSHSERAEEDLDRALNLGVFDLTIMLRQWIDIDPVFEFRTFIWNGSMNGISSLSAVTCCPPLQATRSLHRKEEIKEKALYFWNTQLKPLLLPVVPANQFVLDLYFDAPNDRWFVVELNPWITSAFWLFSPADRVLQTGPTEIRVASTTDYDEVKSQIPDSWWPVIRQSTDTWFQGHE